MNLRMNFNYKQKAKLKKCGKKFTFFLSGKEDKTKNICQLDKEIEFVSSSNLRAILLSWHYRSDMTDMT